MDLIRTETNSGNDSTGLIMGIPGNLFIPVIISLALAVGTAVLLNGQGVSGFQSMFLGGLWVLATLLYLFLFRIGKPPGYDLDLIDLLATGIGLIPNPLVQPPHPLKLAKAVPVRMNAAPPERAVDPVTAGAIAVGNTAAPPPQDEDAANSVSF